LTSQNSLVLSADGRLLFAVNAGSNSVSVFATSGDDLTLLNTVPSGGVFPVSIAVQGNLVYVVNAGGTPNISGFRIHAKTNQLVPLAGSTQNLPGGAAAAPAQVSFSPDGNLLIVTERGENQIDTFVVDGELAQPGHAFPSSTTMPFGFAFGPYDVAIISYQGTNQGVISALSSYRLMDNGNLTVVTPALPSTQIAACWVVVPNNGNFAYVSNPGSGTISSYTVTFDGKLALFNVAAASIAGAPVDLALSNNSRFLYANDNANGAIVGFSIGSDGSLTQVTSVPDGLPFGVSQGIAAR